VYLQASRDILIERNYFRGNGNSINLQTEPPCGVTSPVITGNVVVRNNVMVNPRHHQVVMGAFAGSNVCPPLGYLPVDNVYVTNNTLYRTGAGSLPSIYMPANGANTSPATAASSTTSSSPTDGPSTSRPRVGCPRR
jgi:hypothetical protein